MLTLVSGKEQPVISALPIQPSILITMPFQPKLTSTKQLEAEVRLLVKKAEKLLLTSYSDAVAKPLINRMNAVFRTLNFHSFKKSIAGFFSTSSEKLLYVDIKLKEQLLMNSSFKMRDLLQLKEHPIEYLV